MDLDISISLGRGLSDLSELSILKSCIPPILRKGNNINPRDKIPSPPTHCIIALHKSIGLSKESKSDITVEPVVVKPEVDSNKASVKLNSTLEFKRGMAQSIGSKNHSKLTTKIPNRGVTFG